MTRSRHVAPGQAAGYQYQSEQALLTFVRRKQPRLTLFVERFDDFAVQDGDSALDIVQSKHHLRDGDLTDTGVDLWRTLNAWVSLVEELEADEVPSFLLLTTATAAPGGIAALLRSDDSRDPETALERLRHVAETDDGLTTEPWRNRFGDLAEDIQLRLVRAITVADQQPLLATLHEELRREFAPTVRPEHLDSFVNDLRGWWFGQVAAMLTGVQQGVAIEDLWSHLYELRDSFHVESLPFVYEVPLPTDAEEAVYVASTFTSQLRIVDVADERIRIAIRDYHRAYANTSRWAREGLLLPGELTRYEQRIVDEWDRHFARMRQDLGDVPAEEAMRDAGRALWESLDSDVQLPRLRRLLDEPVITRGTLHALSDEERVGWHPEFRERLRELMANLTA